MAGLAEVFIIPSAIFLELRTHPSLTRLTEQRLIASVTLGSRVTFVDERTLRMQDVELVLPGQANIADGKISILTPMGAALYGLREGAVIDWPDRTGAERKIRVTRVVQP